MREITIAGGGLAGLSLGLRLREQGVPVRLHEAGAYPRHRVCGEFISGQGANLCKAWLPESAHALHLNTVRFFTGHRASPIFRLPKPALSISRYRLDSALAQAFENSGGELQTHSRVPQDFDREGIVRATGRRIAKADSSRWMGLKFHALNLPLGADLELHFSKNAYIGLSRLPDGETNVCGLIRFPAAQRDLAANYREAIASRLHPITRAAFANAPAVEDSFCAVAGLSLKPASAQASSECRIGDSIGMIAPLTGNGMSMAFESALMAAEPLANYSKGEVNWVSARKIISQKCDEHFRRRLRAAWFLQNCVMHSAGQVLFLSSLRTTPRLFGWLFDRTRS